MLLPLNCGGVQVRYTKRGEVDGEKNFDKPPPVEEKIWVGAASLACFKPCLMHVLGALLTAWSILSAAHGQLVSGAA